LFIDLPKLGKAWKTYTKTDESPGFDIELPVIKCNSIPNMKAYVLRAAVDICKYGAENLKKIQNLQRSNSQEIPGDLQEKIDWLEEEVGRYSGDIAKLEKAWKEFVPTDTLKGKIDFMFEYCEKEAQIRALTMYGTINACTEGQLSRYWELVMQARKETHEEREKFGPASSKIMQTDLNSDKQPCETTVHYEPLGNIGIQYIISTYLCQEIDLAKMGDPEYYKKIASWVDTEVLSKYCESNMRCKEDFFIYLEGHTDGHAFKGARYKKSLNIPEGTAFTHFSETDTEEKMTSREITTSLRSNMELGIARAWTVKQQLDFMGVPIRIGAFEHPASEKGGEYRKIDIELNITNLLLDFYEKRLQDLLKRSGIGARPEGC